jgi:hypothetical protein
MVPAAAALRGPRIARLLRQLGAPGGVRGGLATNPDSRAYRGNAEDVGAQLDFQLQVMHRMPMMLSIGMARGFAGGGLGRTEFMASFQVL